MMRFKIIFFILYTGVVFLLGIYAADYFHIDLFSHNEERKSQDGDFSKEKVRLIMKEIEKEKGVDKVKHTPKRRHKKGAIETYTNEDINKDVIQHYRRKKEKGRYTEKEVRKIKREGKGNLVIKKEKKEAGEKEESRSIVEKFFDELRQKADNVVSRATKLTEKPEFKDNPAIKDIMSKDPSELKDSLQNGIKRRDEALKQIESEMP